MFSLRCAYKNMCRVSSPKANLSLSTLSLHRSGKSFSARSLRWGGRTRREMESPSDNKELKNATRTRSRGNSLKGKYYDKRGEKNSAFFSREILSFPFLSPRFEHARRQGWWKRLFLGITAADDLLPKSSKLCAESDWNRIWWRQTLPREVTEEAANGGATTQGKLKRSDALGRVDTVTWSGVGMAACEWW